MENLKGFTLIELVMVMLILSVLSVVAISVLPSSTTYQARLAKDQWLAFFRSAQQLSLLRQNPSTLLSVTIQSSLDIWQAEINQEGQLIQAMAVEQEGLSFMYSTTNFATSCSGLPNISLPTSFYFNSEGELVNSAGTAITENQRLCFNSAESTESICIAPSGYVYEGSCIP